MHQPCVLTIVLHSRLSLLYNKMYLFSGVYIIFLMYSSNQLSLYDIQWCIVQLEYDWVNGRDHGEGDMTAYLEAIDRQIQRLESLRLSLYGI